MNWDSAFGQSLTGSKETASVTEAFGSHYDYAEASYVESVAPQSTSKWEQLQPMMAGQGFPEVQDPTQMEIPTCSALRIRREQNGRDFVNSRLWDNFHATPPTQVSSDQLKSSADPKYMDMNPIGTRKATGQFRHQLDYMPDNALPPTKNSTNPFLQRMDAEGSDARNIVRELRDAVNEDNRERDVEAAKRIAERQFADRWLPPQVAEEAAALQAYELLRPKQYFEMDK
jgi:hypothetical protein